MSESFFTEEMNPLPSPWLKIDHFSYLPYHPYVQGIWHQHSMIEIQFVRSGNGYLHIGNRIIAMSQNSVCVIPPYTLHYVSAEGNEKLDYYSIGFFGYHDSPDNSEYVHRGWSEPVLPEWASSAEALPQPVSAADGTEPSPLARYFLDLSCTVLPDMNPSGYISAGFDLLNQLIASPDRSRESMELFQRTANQLLEWIRYKSIDRRSRGFVPSRIAIQDVLAYIGHHYAEDLQLNFLAHHFGISPAHLNRLFNKYCGLSPRNYIIFFRMTTAIRMLVQSDLSIAEITEKVGYQNQAHFSKLFQQYVGCAPSEFRHLYPNRLPPAPPLR